MNPWSPRFCILRTYSMAFYKNTAISVSDSHALMSSLMFSSDIAQDITGPSSYINLEEVVSVSAEQKEAVSEEFCFSVQTTSDLYYFSLDLRGKDTQGDEWKYNAEELDRQRFAWMNTILALKRAIMFSKFKKIT